MLRAALAEIERQRLIIAALQRNRFGRRSEQLDDATVQQGVEDLEQSVAEQSAAVEAAMPPPSSLQPELPRRPPRAEPAKAQSRRAAGGTAAGRAGDRCRRTRPARCCGGTLHLIGEDRAEMLDYVPAQLRVRVIRRPRYGCRACEEAVVQAPAPERPIDGGMATEALLAHVLVNKYSDHLPLYRQAQIFARQGVTLDRSTLCNWVGRACWWLAPLHELVLSTVLASPKVFADDTTLPVLDPGRGRTKTGRLWCYAVDNRPWCGPGHPAAAYVYSEDRKGEHPQTHLRGFRGLLQVDGYAGFGGLVSAAARAMRRSSPSAGRMRGASSTTSMSQPSRRWPRKRCGASPNSMRSRPTSAARRPNNRRSVRQQRSRPLVEAMQRLADRATARVSPAVPRWPRRSATP